MCPQMMENLHGRLLLPAFGPAGMLDSGAVYEQGLLTDHVI